MRSSLQFILLLFLFCITAFMCMVAAGGILILEDYDNLAVYISLLTFVLGKWTGLAGALFYGPEQININNEDEDEPCCLSCLPYTITKRRPVSSSRGRSRARNSTHHVHAEEMA